MELNDDCSINVTLTNAQWSVLAEFVAHIPCEETRQVTKLLEQQFEQWFSKQENKEKSFVGVLPIKTYNMLIFALSLAPYYKVAGIISEIQMQGEREINRLREQYGNVQSQPEVKQEQPKSTKKRSTRRKSAASK